MNKQMVLGLLAGVAFCLVALEEHASARSVAAYTGKALYGNETHCFVALGDFTPEIFASICEEADLIVPLTVDNSGTKTLTFTASAQNAGSGCRAVANDRYGKTLSASPVRSISVSSNFISRTTGAVSVPSRGVFFADCRTTRYARLVEFDYSP